MNFYSEAFQNDIDITSLDCDIEMDRAQLTINYYNNINNFYKESCNSNEYFTEAGNKIGKAIKKAIDSVIKFINDCVDKVREMITSHRIKKAKENYEKAIKINPSLKNIKIEYNDTLHIAKKYDDIIKKNKSYEDIVKIRHDIDESKNKNIRKVITITAAFSAITAISGFIFMSSKMRKERLKNIADNQQSVIDFDKEFTHQREEHEERMRKSQEEHEERMRKIREDHERKMHDLNEQKVKIDMLLVQLEKASMKEETDTVISLLNSITDTISPNSKTTRIENAEDFKRKIFGNEKIVF